jgi:hypothetical protein
MAPTFLFRIASFFVWHAQIIETFQPILRSLAPTLWAIGAMKQFSEAYCAPNGDVNAKGSVH